MSNSKTASESGPNEADADGDNAIPPLPEKWDRCHAFNERKQRYCRQMPVPLSSQCSDINQPRFCGNHRHLLDEWLSNHKHNLESDAELSSDGAKVKRARTNSPTDNKDGDRKKKGRGKRVPCPIDPSHFIFETAIAKHVLICPAVKQKQDVENKEYYCEGINLGGFGAMGSAKSGTMIDLGEAKELAYAILRAFHFLFLSSDGNPNGYKIGTLDVKGKHCTLSNQQLKNITERDIYNALPEVDLSAVEEGTKSSKDVHSNDQEAKQIEGTATDTKASTGRLTNAVTNQRIKAGGPRHLRQIASILGHVRQNGLISTNESETDNNPLIVEMGAGRGMTGLIVAGAMGASVGQVNSSTKVKLCLVERCGTRKKAETSVRSADKRSKDDCLRLDRVEVTRVKCDLAHVDMSTTLQTQLGSGNPSKTVVIAKHLCGAGTDLALKSLRNAGVIDGCVMATCCHGLCTWNEYVGRDCFLSLFCSDVGGLSTFGEKEFNLLKRWTSASVSGERPISESGSTKIDDNGAKEEHYTGTPEEETGRYPNIFAVAKELGLSCGGKGLGRACQRLIDYGRCDYMRNNLFASDDDSSKAFNVSMLHYVPSDVTPQNALIVASRG